LTVSLASALLIAAAVLALLPLVSLVYDLTHFDDVLRRAAERTVASPEEVSQERSANRIAGGVAIAVVLLTSTALFVPALWLRRGNPVARVLSCVAGVGAALCCCTGYGLSMAARSGSGASDLQSEVSRLSARETPVWVGLIALPAVLVAPLAITAAVLLFVPPSNRFFRPPPAPPAQQPYGGYYVYPEQGWGGGPSRAPGGPPPAPPPERPPHPPDRPEPPPDSAPRG
jgi:hypothetical protein